MTDTPEVSIDESPAALSSPKTVHGIFSLIYTCFHEAGKLCRDDTLSEQTKDLRGALDALPQQDIDALVLNITSVYKALESMRVIGVSFQSDPSTQMILATSTVQFGDRQVDMPAPFDIPSAHILMEQLEQCIAAIKPPAIIMPN